jgi:HEAT repeat protein
MHSHIKCLSFKDGLSREDFYFFIKIFSEKHWRREGDMMVLTTILKEKNIDTIRLNEKVYQAVGETDLVVKEGMDYLKRNEGEIDILVKTLEEVAEIARTDKEKVFNDEIRTNVINKMMELKPELLVNFFKRKRTPKVEKIKDTIVEGLPARQIKEVISKVTTVYKTIKNETPPGSKKEAELLKLKETINSLLSSCRDREASLEIFNMLKDDNLDELLPAWWDKPEKSKMGLLVSKGRILIEKDSAELLDPAIRDDIIKIIRQMEKIGKEEIIRGLLQKLKENFLANTAATRLEAVKFYKTLKPTLDSLANNELALLLEPVLWDIIEKETDETVYSLIADIQSQAIENSVKDCDYQKAREILAIFRKHRALKKEGFQGRAEKAEEYLKKSATNRVLKLLIEDLRSREKERQDNSYKVLLQMEEFMTPKMIGAIKKTADLGLRELMARIIVKVGEKAVLSLISEAEKGIPSGDVKNIIEILPTLDKKSISLAKLRYTMNHYAVEVRVQSVKTAMEFGPDGRDILIYALDDENIKVRTLAIEGMGILKDKELFDLFKNKDKTNIEERLFCEALGGLNMPAAQNYLIKIASPKKRFWRKRKPREVRVDAIKTLEHYPGPKTESVLDRLKNSSDKFIRSNAKYILKKIQEQ